jgi:hypothetical protein
VAQRVLINACALLEQSFPYRPLLWRLYKATLVGAMNRGFRQGREKFSQVKNPSEK